MSEFGFEYGIFAYKKLWESVQVQLFYYPSLSILSLFNINRKMILHLQHSPFTIRYNSNCICISYLEIESPKSYLLSSNIIVSCYWFLCNLKIFPSGFAALRTAKETWNKAKIWDLPQASLFHMRLPSWNIAWKYVGKNWSGKHLLMSSRLCI